MKDILTYVLGVVVCGGLFMAFYHAVIHQRTSFRIARIFLTTSLVASAVIPALNIPVWETTPIEIFASNLYGSGISENYSVVATQAVATDYWQIALWIAYMIGIVTLLTIMICQAVKIQRIKHDSTLCPVNEYNIAISSKVKAPFSFLSTVYLEQGTHPEEMRQILLHETSHIRHRHSVEKIIMEIIKTLMWFNPFAWIAARLLNEVHEFEADNDVLQGGCRVEEYLPLIFKQVFGYTPEISTGLGNSLTKKRFEMMTKKLKHSKYSWLRTVGVLPVAAGMLMLFGFTQQDPQVIVVASKTETVQNQQPEKPDDKATPVNNEVVVIKHTNKYVTTKKGEGEGAMTTVHVASKSNSSNQITLSSKGTDDSALYWLLNENKEIENLDSIDPENISSVSVLKNQAKYSQEINDAIGDRKFDGVIIIETKDPNAPSKVDSRKHDDKTSTITAHSVGSNSEISVQSSSDKGLKVRGVSTPFVWISGSNPHELPNSDMSSIDHRSIESISVLKDGSYPSEIKVAMGDRKFDGVIIIEPKKNAEIGEGLSVEYMHDNKIKVKSSKSDKNLLIWLVNEKQEIKQDQMNKIDPDTIESMSVLKKSPYPDDVLEAIGDRSIDGVILIETKK